MRWNVKSHFSAKQGVLATNSWLGLVASFNREKIEWSDCTFCPIVIQLSWPFNFLHAPHMCLILAGGQSRVASLMHTLNQFFTLSHTKLLHNSHLNIGYLIAELQANLAWNKANKWLNKFNLTYGQLFRQQLSQKL